MLRPADVNLGGVGGGGQGELLLGDLGQVGQGGHLHPGQGPVDPRLPPGGGDQDPSVGVHLELGHLPPLPRLPHLLEKGHLPLGEVEVEEDTGVVEGPLGAPQPVVGEAGGELVPGGVGLPVSRPFRGLRWFTGGRGNHIFETKNLNYT